MPPLTARLSPVPKGRNPEEFYDSAGLVEYYDARLEETDDPKARKDIITKRGAAKRGAALIEANIDTQYADETGPTAKVTK